MRLRPQVLEHSLQALTVGLKRDPVGALFDEPFGGREPQLDGVRLDRFHDDIVRNLKERHQSICRLLAGDHENDRWVARRERPYAPEQRLVLGVVSTHPDEEKRVVRLLVRLPGGFGILADRDRVTTCAQRVDDGPPEPKVVLEYEHREGGDRLH